MTRRVDLAIEGLLTTDGRYIARDALYWPDGLVPLRSPTGRYLGWAKEFRRDPEGRISWVSALVTVDEGFPSLDVDHAITKQIRDILSVARGKVAGITVLSTDGWAWDPPRREHPDEG